MSPGLKKILFNSIKKTFKIGKINTAILLLLIKIVAFYFYFNLKKIIKLIFKHDF
jgi:hypothetical protein